ncbi:MAG: dTDP-4-dehydrorhamnose reductase [Chloroflexi bacterium]|nr:MAG: dTDP-4-dehydrorhamnose reductase [Chloroflexota bacterium]
MRVLVTGANGRLGSQLLNELPQRGHDVFGADVDTLDVRDARSVSQTFETVRPDIVVHCAALTAVDYCAEHPDEALEINGFGTQTVALACQKYDAAIVYLSTNEVFDGKTQRPYLEFDRANPINAYGYSKWVGEQVVRDLVRKHFIVRTSWLFAHGGGNFVQTILRLAQEGQPLRVVVNEVASPTYNNDLAAAISQLIATGVFGLYHLTNEGYISRYAFARQILNLAGFADIPIEPIALAEYRRASTPPEYTMLRNMAAARLGVTLRPWQAALAAFLETEGILQASS